MFRYSHLVNQGDGWLPRSQWWWFHETARETLLPVIWTTDFSQRFTKVMLPYLHGRLPLHEIDTSSYTSKLIVSVLPGRAFINTSWRCLVFSSFQQRLSYNTLSDLALALIDGTVYDIVQGLLDIQHLTEKNLYNQRQKLHCEHQGSCST